MASSAHTHLSRELGERLLHEWNEEQAVEADMREYIWEMEHYDPEFATLIKKARTFPLQVQAEQLVRLAYEELGVCGCDACLSDDFEDEWETIAATALETIEE